MMKPINRVQKIIKYKGVSISAFEKKTGMSNNSIQVAIKKESRLKDETLNNILKTYPEISPEWLLTGIGEMLRPGEEKGETLQILREPQVGYGNPQEATYTVSCLSCQEKEKVVRSLESRLENKDKQIEALERVITEKAQMIKMKEEMLEVYKDRIEELKSKLAEK